MKIQLLLVTSILLMLSCSVKEVVNKVNQVNPQEKIVRPAYAIAIHGGAGTIKKENMTAEREKAYLDKLNEALSVGEEILKKGGSAADAVTQTIMVMENSPLFNAGKGAVFTNAGKNELDASFMDGRTMNAGAVGGVTNIKNPILAAKAVMEKSEHVFLTGKGAEEFSEKMGIETVEPSYFHTERRWNSLQRILAKEGKTGAILSENIDHKFGTVGCAALDKEGNLVAGTSTGGMTNKRYSRIGDAPIIGAGTYANNQTCAVSSTGHGEYFIRYAVAHDISARMEYLQEDLPTAANAVVNEKLVKAGGSGGIIAVDKNGNVAMPFNTSGMYRGYAKPGKREVLIYK